MGVPEVRATLDMFLAGAPVTPERVVVLSDLDRESANEVRRSWPSLGDTTRAELMRHVVSIFLESIDADFVRLGLIATHDADPSVRLAGISTLSESESRETAEELLRLVSDSDDDVREAAIDALGRFVLLGELGTLSQPLTDRITAALRHAATAHHESVEIRSAAIESLGWSSASWVGPILTEAYYSEDRELRLAAVIGMGRSADDQWLEYLFDQIQSDDPEFRTEALNACAEIASDDSLAEVAAALIDEDADVVFAAIAALGEIGGPAALDVLDEYAKEADEDFADAIALARETAKEARKGDMPGEDDE